MSRIPNSLTAIAVLMTLSLAGQMVAAAAQPTDPTQAAIFAGGNLTFESFSTVSGGAVIANGNVHHAGGSLNVESIYAGGNFTHGAAAFQSVTKDLLFGGGAAFGGPGQVVGGDVNVAADVEIEGSTVIQGNVTSGGSTTQSFAFGQINGSVFAGTSANIDGTVLGNVTYGGTVNLGPFADVQGVISPGGPIIPTPYAPLSLPPLSSLTSTGSDVTLSNFQDISLSPGNYGTLNYASGNTVALTSGQYVFADIVSSFSLNEMSFDTSGGPINLFVDGDLDWDLVQVINGQPLFAGQFPAPSESLLIHVEVAGSYIGGASFYGTILAPQGDITLETFTDITGRVLAAGDVRLGNSNVKVVPEPHLAGWLAMLALSASAGRSRRHRGCA